MENAESETKEPLLPSEWIGRCIGEETKFAHQMEQWRTPRESNLFHSCSPLCDTLISGQGRGEKRRKSLTAAMFRKSIGLNVNGLAMFSRVKTHGSQKL